MSLLYIHFHHFDLCVAILDVLVLILPEYNHFRYVTTGAQSLGKKNYVSVVGDIAAPRMLSCHIPNDLFDNTYVIRESRPSTLQHYGHAFCYGKLFLLCIMFDVLNTGSNLGMTGLLQFLFHRQT